MRGYKIGIHVLTSSLMAMNGVASQRDARPSVATCSAGRRPSYILFLTLHLTKRSSRSNARRVKCILPRVVIDEPAI